MGLVYLPTFTIKLSHSCHVVRYTSPMDPSWISASFPMAGQRLVDVTLGGQPSSNGSCNGVPRWSEADVWKIENMISIPYRCTVQFEFTPVEVKLVFF